MQRRPNVLEGVLSAEALPGSIFCMLLMEFRCARRLNVLEEVLSAEAFLGLFWHAEDPARHIRNDVGGDCLAVLLAEQKNHDACTVDAYAWAECCLVGLYTKPTFFVASCHHSRSLPSKPTFIVASFFSKEFMREVLQSGVVHGAQVHCSIILAFIIREHMAVESHGRTSRRV